MATAQSGFQQWNYSYQTFADQIVLAKAVNPNAEGIEDIVRFAKNRPADGNPFGGVATSATCIRQKAHDLFEVLSDYLTTTRDPYFGNPPYHPRLKEQLIRTPELMLKEPAGTCIDWVVLLASVLVRACLHPLILVVGKKPEEPEHAILGCWLDESDALPGDGVLFGGQLGSALGNHCPNASGMQSPLFAVLDASYVPPDDNGKYRTAGEAEEEAYGCLPEELRAFCETPPGSGAHSSHRKVYLHCVVDVSRAQELLADRPVGWELSDTLREPRFFQRRSEFDELMSWYRQWWMRSDLKRVCALVGEGGIGKTALVEALLAALPGVPVTLDNVPKDDTLEPPDGLIVLDCGAESLSPGRCLETLFRALTGNSPATPISSQELQNQLSEPLWSDRRILFVLDSFETLLLRQSDDSLEARIADNELWVFLKWCCQSMTPVRVLLTSRLGLPELDVYRSFMKLVVPPMEPEIAVALLRDHGVHGELHEIQSIPDRLGGHAILIDTAGVVLRERSGGDASRFNEVIPEGLVGEDVVDKLIESHEKNIPLEWVAVMRYVSLFSAIPASAEVLAAIIRPKRRDWPGTVSRLQDALKGLSKRALVHRRSPSGDDARAIYRPHDILGSYFSESQRFSPMEKVEFRRAILRYVRRVAPRRLSDRRSDVEASQLLELAHQLSALGKQRAANRVYRRRMSKRWDFVRRQGPYDRLSRLNLLSLGLRTIESVLAATASRRPSIDRLLPWQVGRLWNDKGGFERELGALQASEESYNSAKGVVERAPRYWWYVPGVRGRLRLNLSFALRNPTRTFIFRGLLGAGFAAATGSWEHERRVGDREGQQISLCLQGRALGFQGRVEEAGECYKRAQELGRRKLKGHFFTKCYAARWAQLLLRTGNIAAANELIEETLKRADKEDLGENDLLRLICRLLVVIRDGSQDGTWKREATAIRDLAREGNRRELEAWSLSILAVLALESGDRALCRESIDDGLALCERYGYALHWIDLQVARGRLDLLEADTETDPAKAPQCVLRAHTAARLALYGKPLRDEDDPGEDSRQTSVEELSMVGAANVACKYRWGMVNALGLLADANEHNNAPKGLPVPEGKRPEYFRKLESRLRRKLQPVPSSVPNTLG